MKKQLYSTIIALLFILFVRDVSAQKTEEKHRRDKPLIISVFNVGAQLPSLRIITTPLHPGLSAGTEFPYNSSEKNRFFQTVKAGVYYHQYIQTSVQVYSEAGYRRALWKGTAAEFRLGAGYLHAFTGTEVFQLENGTYRKKNNLGRPQFMGSTALGLSYQKPGSEKAPRFFMDYQFFLQMPFIKKYVPMAPATVFHIGAAFPMIF
ncbi:MAG: hypothetical protein ACK5FV_10655 [Bacteroidota bacterium]|jgi:hypothetical protein